MLLAKLFYNTSSRLLYFERNILYYNKHIDFIPITLYHCLCVSFPPAKICRAESNFLALFIRSRFLWVDSECPTQSTLLRCPLSKDLFPSWAFCVLCCPRISYPSFAEKQQKQHKNGQEQEPDS